MSRVISRHSCWGGGSCRGRGGMDRRCRRCRRCRRLSRFITHLLVILLVLGRRGALTFPGSGLGLLLWRPLCLCLACLTLWFQGSCRIPGPVATDLPHGAGVARPSPEYIALHTGHLSTGTSKAWDRLTNIFTTDMEQEYLNLQIVSQLWGFSSLQL